MLDPMAALEAASEPIRAPAPMVTLEAHGSPFDFFEAFQRARPVQPPARSSAAARSAAPPACVPDPAIGRPSEEYSKQSSQLPSHRELYSREAGKVASFLASEKTTPDDGKLQHARQALPLVWGRRLLSNSLPGGLSVPPRKLPRSAMQASTGWTVLDEECACPVCNQPFTSIGARASHLNGMNDAEHVAFRDRDAAGIPNTPRRWRQKQIGHCKNSLAYQRYLEEVPLDKRHSDHPRTPEMRDTSNRTFKLQVRAWEQQLNDFFGPPEAVEVPAPAPSATAPGAEIGAAAGSLGHRARYRQKKAASRAGEAAGGQGDGGATGQNAGETARETEARQSELSTEESIDQGVQGDANRQTTMAEVGDQEDDGVESESNDGDDCAREAPPRPSDTWSLCQRSDAGGGLSFTIGPAAPVLAPPPLAARPNATEEQLREMVKDREDTSRALMLELRASEDGRLAAEAAWSRAEAELVRWQRGELRLVPEVTDVETGQVSSTVVTENEEQRRGLKRPCEPSALAHTIETSQKTVKIKQEAVEQRAAAADAKGRLEDQLACVVCMEQPRSVVLRPCSHYVCCSVCASQQTHCPSAGCSVLVTSRLQGICMAPHQQAFEMGTGPPE